ncbi:unnamed protein product [Microthlaspi erraticum]|uniref:Uncharacterized protein n=1 Tax=Microthlaspi erraticum TaxID=1685480 RepID=A0A6D2IUY6_9BRAS|nr:unnamed protein product [Microthlaspi erraticum]
MNSKLIETKEEAKRRASLMARASAASGDRTEPSTLLHATTPSDRSLKIDGAFDGASGRSAAAPTAADDRDGNPGGANANAYILSHLLSCS